MKDANWNVFMLWPMDYWQSKSYKVLSQKTKKKAKPKP